MSQLRLMLLSNVGYRSAYYPGITLNFCNADTNQPENSIIWLANQGGKTTLISLLFTNIEPDKRRFVQHLQKQDHHFSDYFHSTPGAVVLELQTGGADLSGTTPPLIIGQCVVVQDGGNAQRVFFGFSVNDKLGLDDLPFKGTNTEVNVSSLAEFRHWLDEARNLNSTVYYGENQLEWKKWLDSMGVEHDLLAKQIDFCRSEGGISDFASFKDERTFLEQFFMLALDEKIANQAHESLHKAHQQYKDMPILENRRKIYSELLAGFQEIQPSATKHQECTKEITLHDAQLNSLLHKIWLRQKWLDFQIQDIEKKSEKKKIEAHEKQEELESTKHLIKQITLTLKSKKYLQAEKNLEDEIDKLSTAEKRCNLLEAVRAYEELETVQIKHDEITRTINTASKNIEPKEAELRGIGSKLRALYSTSIEKLKEQLTESERAIKKLGNDIESKEQNKEKLTHQLKSERTVRDKSSQWLESYSIHHEKLAEKSRLLSLDGKNLKVLEAERYWKELHTEQTNKLQEVRTQHENQEKEIKQQNRILSDLESSLAVQASELGKLQKDLSTAKNEREALKASPVLCKLAQMASINPDEEALLVKLDKSIVSLSKVLGRTEVRIEELNIQKDWLEKDRLAKPDQNTERALDWLADQGVDAIYYPHYISKQNLDADTARSLVESDPARFYGIQVNSLSKLESLLEGINREELGLSQPVVISKGCISIEHHHDHVVLPVRNDAAYNEKAAKSLLSDINTKLADLSQNKEDNQIIYDEQKGIRETLSLYQKQYGRHWFEIQEKQINTKHLEISEGEEKKKYLDKKINSLSEGLITLSNEIQHITNLAQSAHFNQRAISDFIESFESKKVDEKRKNDEALSEIKRIKGEMTAIDEMLPQLKSKLQRHQSNKEKIEKNISRNNELSSSVTHYSETSDIGILDLSELPTTNEKYNACLNSYNALLADKDLKGLQGQLEIISSDLVKVKNKFIESKDEFSESEIEEEKSRVYASGSDLSSLIKNENEILRQLHSSKGIHEEKKRRADEIYQNIKKQHPKVEELEEKTSIPELEDQLHQAEKKQHNIEHHINSLNEEVQSIIGRGKEYQNEKEQIQTGLNFLPEILTVDSTNEVQDLPSAENIDQKLLFNEANQTKKEIDELKKKQGKLVYQISSLFKKSIFPIADDPEKAALIGAVATDIKLYSDDQLISQAETHALVMKDYLDAVESQISTNRDKLEFVHSSFNRLLDEADTALHAAFRVRIPEDIMHYSGKEILRSKLQAKHRLRETYSEDQRRSMYLEHINDTVKNQSVDENGYKLATVFLLHAYDAVLDNSKTKSKGNLLNIQIIKPHDVEVGYIPVNKMIGSGGEGLTAGLLLYLVIAKIRGEFMGKGEIGKTGSFLLLDNPFSKANKVDLIRPQTRLAKKLNIQLIFATGIEDLNAVGEFEHVIRLRKDRMDINSKRQYIEFDNEQKNQISNDLQDLDKYRIQSADYSYRSSDPQQVTK